MILFLKHFYNQIKNKKNKIEEAESCTESNNNYIVWAWVVDIVLRSLIFNSTLRLVLKKAMWRISLGPRFDTMKTEILKIVNQEYGNFDFIIIKNYMHFLLL